MSAGEVQDRTVEVDGVQVFKNQLNSPSDRIDETRQTLFKHISDLNVDIRQNEIALEDKFHVLVVKDHPDVRDGTLDEGDQGRLITNVESKFPRLTSLFIISSSKKLLDIERSVVKSNMMTSELNTTSDLENLIEEVR